VALFDPDLEAAATVAADFPGSICLRAIEEADWAAIDAAIVSTPPSARVPVVTAALRAGVPTLMEKPIGPNAAAVEEIAEALRERRVLTAVGYMNRYRASVQRLRAELDGERVFAIACRWMASAYRKPWWFQADGSGGPLNDYATHLIDLCRYLVGEIDEVGALAYEDEEVCMAASAAVSLRFAGGACGSLLYSCLGEKKDISLDIFFRGGSARLEGWNFRRPGEGVGDREDIFIRETEIFLQAATGSGHVAPLSDFEDALRTQRVVDSIGRAVRTGQPQEVSRAEL
jgi:myo-inositol 2-dehydrogenase / D-chiro-inositol 1-dehydrogenase